MAKIYIITDFLPGAQNAQSGGKVNSVEKFMTTEEVAALLRQKPRTITDWAVRWRDSGGDEGIPGGKKLGRRWLFDREVLMQHLNSEKLMSNNGTNGALPQVRQSR